MTHETTLINKRGEPWPPAVQSSDTAGRKGGVAWGGWMGGWVGRKATF